MVTQATTRPEPSPEQIAYRKLLALLKEQIKDDATSLRAEKCAVRDFQREFGSGSAATLQSQLHHHRLEARARLLIYGLLRGRTWDQIEPKHAEVNPLLRYWITQVWARSSTFGVPMPAHLEDVK